MTISRWHNLDVSFRSTRLKKSGLHISQGQSHLKRVEVDRKTLISRDGHSAELLIRVCLSRSLFSCDVISAFIIKLLSLMNFTLYSIWSEMIFTLSNTYEIWSSFTIFAKLISSVSYASRVTNCGRLLAGCIWDSFVVNRSKWNLRASLL